MLSTISGQNTLLQNVSLAYADKRITRTELAQIQNALVERHPGSTFESAYAIDADILELRASGVQAYKTATDFFYPTGKPRIVCTTGVQGCDSATKMANMGIFMLTVASNLSSGFNPETFTIVNE